MNPRTDSPPPAYDVLAALFLFLICVLLAILYHPDPWLEVLVGAD